MLYQIKVSEKASNKYKKLDKIPDPILLHPRLEIGDVAYWQKRAAQLLPNSHITCQVAKNKTKSFLNNITREKEL